MAPSPSASPTTARILRRTDVYLLPFLSLLFLLNSLDRSNIGNAETAGFTRHAGLKERDLNDAVAAFFVTFVALQPVGAALGKRVGVGRWVGGVMVGWGLLTAGNAFVRTRAQLICLRVAIGALEAGFYPTTVFYLSLFYTRYEFAQRLGMFYGQYAVAGAFGGLLSYLVFRAFPSKDLGISGEDHTGWYSYQLLFIFEGLVTVVVALITFLWLPSGPSEAWWLTPREREIAADRILRDRQGDAADFHDSGDDSEDDVRDGDDDAESESADVEVGRAATPRKTYTAMDPMGSPSLSDEPEERWGLLSPTPSASAGPSSTTKTSPVSTNAQLGGEASLTPQDVASALMDPKIWFLLAINILSSVPGMAFSVFLPLVLRGLQYSPLASNLLTVPPFLLGAVTLWSITYASDRARRRIRFVIIGLGINLVGLLAAAYLPSSAYAARYVALCVLLAGSYVASPLTVAWITANTPVPGKRAVLLGVNGWGNLAGVLASRLYAPSEAPEYRAPLRWTLVLVALSAAGYAMFEAALRWENHRRAKVVATWETEDRMREERDGRGPAKDGVWRRALMRRVGVKEEGRRGDEKLTFSYGL